MRKLRQEKICLLAFSERVAGATHDLTTSVLVSLQGRPTECSLRILTNGGVIDLDLFPGFATIDSAPVSRSAKIGSPFQMSTHRMARAGPQTGHARVRIPGAS